MHSRLKKNVAGDFYTTGKCLACEIPEGIAPSLLAPLGSDGTFDTYFIKQPQCEEELKLAISALSSCCVNALRYGGKDPEILKRLSTDVTDYVVDKRGNVIKNQNTSEK